MGYIIVFNYWIHNEISDGISFNVDVIKPLVLIECFVGGLMAALMMSILLLPTLYVWVARDDDKLPRAEAEFVE